MKEYALNHIKDPAIPELDNVHVFKASHYTSLVEFLKQVGYLGLIDTFCSLRAPQGVHAGAGGAQRRAAQLAESTGEDPLDEYPGRFRVLG